jgi:hypothetical protein
MDIDYNIAIRSKGRYNTINDKTLKLLNKWDIDSKRIYIFCPVNEINLYQQNCPGINIVDGGTSIVDCNNRIIDYFDEGSYIIQMDDDVHYLLELGTDHNRIKVNNKLRPKGFVDLDLNKLIIDGYNLMIDKSVCIWGTYPVANSFYMKNLQSPTFDLKFLIGRIFGFLNHKSIRTKSKSRDDYEKSLLYYIKYGSVIRFNHITVYADTYVGMGGLAEERTSKLMSEDVDEMINKYPTYIAEKKHKGKYREIRFIKQK